VLSVVYSPDGRYIISGSHDKTIRIWDAETGAAIGNPLEGHTRGVQSVAYSPNGRHIISGSHDKTIRIWDAEAGAAVRETANMMSIAYSPDVQHIVSGADHDCTHVEEPSPHETSSSRNLVYPHFCSQPDSQGWVRDSDGGLLYWVPLDCRRGLHSPALITIPMTSDLRSVSLGFDDFAFGTAWTEIFSTAQC